MTPSRRFLLVSLALAAGLALAQGEPVGIVSFIDIEGGGLRTTSCVTGEPDPRACLPNVEMLHVPSFLACAGAEPGACEHKVAYPAPFLDEPTTDRLEEDLELAWAEFVTRVIAEANDRLNALPACWVPTPCPPAVDWACVAGRLAGVIEATTAEVWPDYWGSVYERVGQHAPFALHWRSLHPDDGAVIAPFYSLTPNPGQYAGLVDEPRDAAYYFQGPAFPRLPVPHTLQELDREHGGLTSLEERKRALAPATLLEYQQFGFVALLEVYGAWHLAMLFDPLQGPYLVAACLTLLPPFVVPVPVPVPVSVAVPRAFVDRVTVPEGYAIPRIRGEPLF